MEDPTRPASTLCKEVVVACQERGVLVITAGVHGNVIRILVPITAEDAIVDEGLGILGRALDELEMVARERIELSTPGL